MTILIITAAVPPVSLAQTDSLSIALDAINGVEEWQRQSLGDDTQAAQRAGENVYDWLMFTKGRAGTESAELFAAAQEAYFKENADTMNPSDMQRTALACASCGGDIAGNGMLAAVCGSVGEELSNELINRLIFALHVADTGFYTLPEGTSFTRAELIAEITSRRTDSGALYMLNTTTPETDVTAMAVSALAPYVNGGEDIRGAVDDMISYLSTTLTDDCTAQNWGAPSCETTAQLITALCAVGIDPSADARFTRNGSTLIDGLMTYRTDDGGFAHNEDSTGSDSYATMQAYYSLTAFVRFKNGRRALFDMRAEQTADISAKIARIRSAEQGEDILAEYESLPNSEKMYAYSAAPLDKTAGYAPDDITADEPTVPAKSIMNDTLPPQSLTGGNDTFSALEQPSQSAQSESSGAVRRVTLAETVILVTIALAAACAIILNHTVFKRERK